MTTAVMFTRVPSSYYLSAQAELAEPGFLKNNFGNYPAKEDYLRSFGHSPEFTPYAEVYNDILPDYDRNLASVIAAEFTYCHNPLTERYKSFTPARVSNYKAGGGATDFNCCGDCKRAVLKSDCSIFWLRQLPAVPRIMKMPHRRVPLSQTKTSTETSCFVFDQ